MGIFNFLETPEGRSKAGQAVQDVILRGIAGGLGAPVDFVQTDLLKPFGYEHPAPIGSSEWIGNLMEQAGMVSKQRYPVSEFIVSMAFPSAALKGRKAVGLFSEGLSTLGGSASGVGGNSLLNQIGAISPEGRARLLADLQARIGSGTYRVGNLTEGQGKGVDALFGRPSASRDVYMTDKATEHLLDGRVRQDGFSPEEVVKFVEQAMSGRARPDLNAAKARQHPSLVNSGLRDPITGRAYDTRMPLRQVETGYELRSVIPEGLLGKYKKTPKR